MYFQHNILLHATAHIVPHGVFLSIQGCSIFTPNLNIFLCHKWKATFCHDFASSLWIDEANVLQIYTHMYSFIIDEFIPKPFLAIQIILYILVNHGITN